ncbi:phage major tail tube protein [Paenibacillus sp. CN-4]|uniref:phage major tail tube protein n=1 Tax=Paenibacillus nanchangensis TaxID=3348343 RepID=UPI00397A4C7D
MVVRSERITEFSVFKDGTEYLGVATADLPEITFLSDTIKGAGIAGQLEAPSRGLVDSLTLTLNWRTIEEGSLKLLAPIVHSIDLRGSIERFNTATDAYEEVPIKVTTRGRPLSGGLGGLEAAATMDSSNSFSLSYLKVSIDNKEYIEIDKLNYIYKVFGNDYLAQMRKNLAL